MLKFFFRIAFFLLGLYITYTFGKDMLEPCLYKVSGQSVQGRIYGFLAGRKDPSVQPESTGVRKGKRRARRPAFRYPVSPGATDSLDGRSSTAVFPFFVNYSMNEGVEVVFAKGKPEKAYIWSFSLLFTAFLCVLFGLFMIRMGLLGRM